MTQFEYDQLAVLAGAWSIVAGTKEEPVAHAYRRCASELRELIGSMSTAPGGPPDGEPEKLPPMRWPSDRPTLPGDDPG